jgi:hypothetical protein
VKVSEVLNGAAQVIEVYGWRRHHLGDRECGFCVLGATNEAAGNDSTAFGCAVSELRKDIGYGSAAAWNDNRAKDASEVTAQLRKTAQRLAAIGQ